MNTEILDANFSKPPVDIVAILKKYALLLGIVILFQIAARIGGPILLDHFFRSDLLYNFMTFFSMSYLIFNLIIAAILYSDMKRYDIVSKSVIFLTLVNVDAGVCFFILFLFYHQNKNSGN
jgi:hypothetical protein